MNSNKLLEQARETAEKQLELAGQIEDAEQTIEAAKKGAVCFFVHGTGTVNIGRVVDPEKLDAVKELALVAIMNFRDDRTMELEKLLGIRKPATLNPEFEAAVIGMENSVTVKKNCITGEVVVEPDPVETKLADILHCEVKRIEDKPIIPEDNDKYPAKRRKSTAYPEGMTEEVVKKMYIDELKTIASIAKHFGVTYTKAANFISYYKLNRTHYDKASKTSENQPEETERP